MKRIALALLAIAAALPIAADARVRGADVKQETDPPPAIETDRTRVRNPPINLSPPGQPTVGQAQGPEARAIPGSDPSAETGQDPGNSSLPWSYLLIGAAGLLLLGLLYRMVRR